MERRRREEREAAEAMRARAEEGLSALLARVKEAEDMVAEREAALERLDRRHTAAVM